MTSIDAVQKLVEEATRHADAAMADLEQQTGDERSSYYTQGLTNWIPVLAVESRTCAVLAQALVEAWRALEQIAQGSGRFADLDAQAALARLREMELGT